MTSNTEIINKLKNEYPALAIELFWQIGMNKEADEYMQGCKNCESVGEQYSRYIHGWLLI